MREVLPSTFSLHGKPGYYKFISLCNISFKHFLKSYTRYINQDNFQKLMGMSDVCTRVTRTLEVPFIQRNRTHLFLSLFISWERDIFRSNVPNCQYWIEVLRHCHHRCKFTQVQRTLLEYTLYPFPPFFRFCWLIICTLLLLSLEAHFAPLGSANLARWLKEIRQAILRTNFMSRQELTVHATRRSIWSRVSTSSRHIKLTICNGSDLPVQKLLSLPISFGASKTFSLHCPL